MVWYPGISEQYSGVLIDEREETSGVVGGSQAADRNDWQAARSRGQRSLSPGMYQCKPILQLEASGIGLGQGHL